LEGAVAKQNRVSLALTTAQKMETGKMNVWCGRDAICFAKAVLCDRAINHPWSPPNGSAGLGSPRLGFASQTERLVWTRRPFCKTNRIWRRRDDTHFVECAFGVDETRDGKCIFLQVCVLRRRDATLQNAFPIISQKTISSSAPDGRSASQNKCLVWARRHFPKKTYIWCRRDDT
jgi:hypothetical protein